MSDWERKEGRSSWYVLLQVGDKSSTYLIPVGESTVVFIATSGH